MILKRTNRLKELVAPEGRDNDATTFPFWYVAERVGIGKVRMASSGFWFSRKAAEAHLMAKAYRYGKNAFVYCGSGHDSGDVRALYALANEDAPSEASND